MNNLIDIGMICHIGAAIFFAVSKQLEKEKNKERIKGKSITYRSRIRRKIF